MDDQDTGGRAAYTFPDAYVYAKLYAYVGGLGMPIRM